MSARRFKARLVFEWEYDVDMNMALEGYGTTFPLDMALVDRDQAESDPVLFLDSASGGFPAPVEILVAPVDP